MTITTAIDNLLSLVKLQKWTETQKQELIGRLSIGSSPQDNVENALNWINEEIGEAADDKCAYIIGILGNVTISSSQLNDLINELNLIEAPKDVVKKVLRWIKDLFD